MKILLEQEGRHLRMFVVHSDTHADDMGWAATIADMDAELRGRQGVKRMSYDTWHWDLRKRREAEEYITYFYLKHGQ